MLCGRQQRGHTFVRQTRGGILIGVRYGDVPSFKGKEFLSVKYGFASRTMHPPPLQREWTRDATAYLEKVGSLIIINSNNLPQFFNTAQDHSLDPPQPPPPKSFHPGFATVCRLSFAFSVVTGSSCDNCIRC